MLKIGIQLTISQSMNKHGLHRVFFWPYPRFDPSKSAVRTFDLRMLATISDLLPKNIREGLLKGILL